MANASGSTSHTARETGLATATATGAEQTTTVASSNAATSQGSNYQVFLSFREPDTGKTFTSSLYQDLIDARIRVFLDDEELSVGAKIDGSLEQAINNSKIYIPIFSQNYASSEWCLDELKQIVSETSTSNGNKEIRPIFLDVTFKDVSLQTLLYNDAIEKLKREKELSNELVGEWRKALVEVGGIKGWEGKKYKGYGKLTKEVVEEVVKKLKTKHKSVPPHVIGIDDQVSKVKELLEINSGDVRFIRIHGMGGIGKTTLVTVVFNELCSDFGKYCCFLKDIRVKSSPIDRLVEVQKKLLHGIGVHAGTEAIDDIDDGMKRIADALCNMKVLIVLDDIDNREQMEKLVGQVTFGSGSRILITTRYVEDLPGKYPILDYEMVTMGDGPALELFSRHAFNEDSPSNAYNDLSTKIVSATGKLPLALEVIGSSLYRKYLKKQWEETLAKLKKAPHKDVFEKLRISYDALTSEEQKIFLDIACFFVGEDKMSAIYVWEDCEFYPYTGIDVLIRRSLVKIAENDKFWMHDQLRDLGREIVKRENEKKPEKRSRLWDCQEILGAMGTNKMKKNVEALDLDLRKGDPEVIITSDEIGRFNCLKYLKLTGGTFTGNLANSLTNLSWILWSQPHPNSDPTNVHLKNVVVLQFSDNDFIDDSKLQSLITMARKLKVLSLKGCDKITRTPHLSECSNLESLNADHCSDLGEIDRSIGKLKCLIEMKITYCPSLTFLPEEIGDLEKLEHLTVQRCDGVKRLPESIWKSKSLREVHFLTGSDVYSANS